MYSFDSNFISVSRIFWEYERQTQETFHYCIVNLYVIIIISHNICRSKDNIQTLWPIYNDDSLLCIYKMYNIISFVLHLVFKYLQNISSDKFVYNIYIYLDYKWYKYIKNKTN